MTEAANNIFERYWKRAKAGESDTVIAWGLSLAMKMYEQENKTIDVEYKIVDDPLLLEMKDDR